MITKITSIENKPIFSTEDYILYILNHLEPKKSDKIRLNKIAFFGEFAYLFHYGKPLSNADYAAIDKGPVIHNYDLILNEMRENKKVAIDGYIVRPLKSPDKTVSESMLTFLDNLIKKYSSLSKDELISLSHSTDSYKITTNNEKTMGRLIDKNLAMLETFFDEKENDEGLIKESKLPKIQKNNLIKYGAR